MSTIRRKTALTGSSRRPPARKHLAPPIVAVTLAVVVAMLASLTASASLGGRGPLRAGLAELIRYYGNDGLIGASWWQSAVALSTVETYAQTTGDTSYDAVISATFAGHSDGKFENGSDDDTAWWALTWLQAYDITHDAKYLSMARADADYIHEDWDSTCGGGVWWQRSRYYKNAISNELFLELTAWLHNSISGDSKYLRWATAEWSWFEHSGMINSASLINDGLGVDCTNDGDLTWTYNQGVILAGLARLYQATGNRALLTSAERIARAAIGQLTVAGVLDEPCSDAGCTARLDADTQSFKGIFVRNLKVLAVAARTKQFNGFFRRQAQAIEAHDTGPSHQFGMFWAGPVTHISAASQASALDALIASYRA